MQKYGELVFDVFYLVGVILIGLYLISKGKKHSEVKWFGVMAALLGFGDSFHLVPRVAALWTTGLDSYVVSLGIGKLITSITMTFFYYLLFRIIVMITKKDDIVFNWVMIILAIIRIGLCLMPQNLWTSLDAPLSWGIYRNIPFMIMGLMMIYKSYVEFFKTKNQYFKWMFLAIALSFAFYAPVVLWADVYPIVGVLMIPKTIAYFWIVVMGYRYYKGNFAE